MTRAIWVVVALIFIARVVAAFSLPLTGDEAYYWEWSRRLAFGYIDHPPFVAWTIRAFSLLSPFGNVPGVVRTGFLLCGVIATLALAQCATVISGDRRAGAVTALLFSLAPLVSVAFGSATPDGPFLMFWCLALWFAARAFRFGHTSDFVLLGLALGGALMSRVFAVALVAGIVAFGVQQRQRASSPRLLRRRIGLALVLAFLSFVPFLVWNAQHGWISFAFALLHRHEESRSGFSLLRLVMLEVGAAVAYSPGIWALAILCAARPRNALLAWSALPLLVVLTALVLFENVEVYWLLGPFASLCGLAGIAFLAAAPPARTAWTVAAAVPATVLLGLMFALTFVPGPAYALLQRTTHLRLRNSGPFEIFAFAPLAHDVAQLAQARDAVVMTDGYGFSSVLDFDAGVAPVVIGYDWQGRESHMWYPSTMRPRRALFVDKEPLASRRDFQLRLAQACARVTDGGIHQYRYGSAPPRAFYFTWCDGLKPDGIAILRWETP
ncbi:MAG: glycosyltransferase family 39 protein [Candidatus Eremiobacteraeota bacterium]|nr:glycosyltransferase family 39 protein [Candidatus Eremiobacteraeota bacterium]